MQKTKLENQEIFTHSDPEYNYQHFNAKEETKASFSGPQIGEKAYNFKARTLDGEEVQLGDFLGKTVVLESGSYTCPSYVNYIKQMNEISHKYEDVVFIVLYTREAHPGGINGPHLTIDQKILSSLSRKSIHTQF